MSVHELKTWPPYFQAIWDGSKTFEVRPVQDRVFGVGDTLHLREFDPCVTCSGRGFFTRRQDGWRHFKPHERVPCATCKGTCGHYTGREAMTEISYVLEGGHFGITKGYVVMAFKLGQRAGASARLPKLNPHDPPNA